MALINCKHQRHSRHHTTSRISAVGCALRKQDGGKSGDVKYYGAKDLKRKVFNHGRQNNVVFEQNRHGRWRDEKLGSYRVV
jgi:hypothetical protein